MATIPVGRQEHRNGSITNVFPESEGFLVAIRKVQFLQKNNASWELQNFVFELQKV